MDWVLVFLCGLVVVLQARQVALCRRLVREAKERLRGESVLARGGDEHSSR